MGTIIAHPIKNYCDFLVFQRNPQLTKKLFCIVQIQTQHFLSNYRMHDFLIMLKCFFTVLRPDINLQITMDPVSPGNPTMLRCDVTKVAQDFVQVWEWHKDGQKIAGRDWNGLTRNRGKFN